MGSLKTFRRSKTILLCGRTAQSLPTIRSISERWPVRRETAAHSRGANEGCRLRFANPLCLSGERAGELRCLPSVADVLTCHIQNAAHSPNLAALIFFLRTISGSFKRTVVSPPTNIILNFVCQGYTTYTT